MHLSTLGLTVGLALGLLAAPSAARAQQAVKVYVGYVEGRVNTTGLALVGTETIKKGLELLKEGAPLVSRVAINRKTAKALGLTVPPSVLLRADQVIE